MNLRKQLQAFDNGVFLESDGRENTGCYNFYDWFCKDSSLEKKSIGLWKKVKTFLKHNPQIDLDTNYVFFKNNCPMRGPLYDSFSICNVETRNVIYWVTPKSGHTGKAEICFFEIGFGDVFKEADTFTGLFKD